MRGVVLVAILLAGGGCARKTAPPPAAVDVKTWGGLRRMMHGGQTGAVVSLRDVVPGPDLYAIGALGDLRGEITIVRDRIWVAYADEPELRVEPGRENATLLVAARVSAWRTERLGTGVRHGDLAAMIERRARAAGLDTERPFPFLLEGRFRSLQWHIVDGRKLRPGAGHHEHIRSAVRRSARDAHAVLVGFFSKHHQGVFTHMGERIHIHAVVGNDSGHLDDAEATADVVLRLPAAGGKSLQRLDKP